MNEQGSWMLMYLGAFAALGMTNVALASELAQHTRSDKECVHAIGVMRRAREGDRVWPALESLRAMRALVGDKVPMTMKTADDDDRAEMLSEDP